uniref:Fibrillar collagen NC1 domain-containing protein n=1 Tax=Daphnia galeata TaxID=27404 RepID=A0A8J2WQ15_9CRUS|nr:unnamed protein product [Daphnia galeata]
MARFSSVITTLFIRSSILVLLLWSTCSNSAVLSMDEKYAHLEEKIAKLEDKYAHFETLIKIKDQQHDILAKEVSQLKLALENKTSSSKSVTSLNDVNSLPSALKNIMPRTCHEAKLGDPSIKSGMQWIDPDGQGIGDDPIYVYCDMSSGSTLISHDSESPVDVGSCADPGCYSKAINYNAPIRQLIALTELSGECQQSVKVSQFKN